MASCGLRGYIRVWAHVPYRDPTPALTVPRGVTCCESPLLRPDCRGILNSSYRRHLAESRTGVTG